jgi:hypothetical protein
MKAKKEQEGGLTRPAGMHFGPDGDLYVLKWSGSGTADDMIYRYDGRSGDFLERFVTFNNGIRYTDKKPPAMCSVSMEEQANLSVSSPAGLAVTFKLWSSVPTAIYMSVKITSAPVQ